MKTFQELRESSLPTTLMGFFMDYKPKEKMSHFMFIQKITNALHGDMKKMKPEQIASALKKLSPEHQKKIKSWLETKANAFETRRTVANSPTETYKKILDKL